MYGDVVRQRGKKMHFFQPSLHQNKTLKLFYYTFCHNPNLGLATKARVCKGVGQERSLGVTFHAPEKVGKCEGMNFHIPK